VLVQLQRQLDRDRQLLDWFEQASSDPVAAEACRAIEHEVKAGADVWIRLERFPSAGDSDLPRGTEEPAFAARAWRRRLI